MSDAAPPPGWQVHRSSRTGKVYFFNPKTGESMYEHPATKRRRVDDGAGRPSPMVAPARSAAPPATAYPAYPMQYQAAATRPGYPTPKADPSALGVRSAYDRQREQSKEEREQSDIIAFRGFQNWIKSILISDYSPHRPARVLDLACGKFGDIQKWQRAGVHQYVGIDISRQQVARAAERLNSENIKLRQAIQARLISADLGAVDLRCTPALQADETFDAISIQFALHYLFQSEERALTFFRNIAHRLRPGGVFLGTLPDANHVIRRVREVHRERMGKEAPADPTETNPFRVLERQNGEAADGGANTAETEFFRDHGRADHPRTVAAAGDVQFGNNLFRVSFPKASVARQYALGSNPFGLRYTFFLQDAVDNVDEYVVPWSLLVRLARSVGLEPVVHENFHAFYHQKVRDPAHKHLFNRMVKGTLSDQEWEMAGFYCVFVFERVHEKVPTMRMPALPQHDPAMVGALRERSFIEPSHILELHPDGTFSGGALPLAPAPEAATTAASTTATPSSAMAAALPPHSAAAPPPPPVPPTSAPAAATVAEPDEEGGEEEDLFHYGGGDEDEDEI